MSGRQDFGAAEALGELACLLAQAPDLADRTNDTGDRGDLWRLAVLLRCGKARCDDLHDCAGVAVMAAEVRP